ncbi:MAG: nitroreductase/quinone reductase family protein [Chloroflexota bacterium]
MHLPRDPGEWIQMAILMAVVMTVGMLAAHALRSHLRGDDRGAMRPGLVMSVIGGVVGLLLRIGIPVAILGPLMLLSVRGRRTGRVRTVPVDVHDVAGRRYLIATHGVGAWVVNLRDAGEGTLRLGRRRTRFTSRELAAEEAADVLGAALGPLLATDGWRGSGLRANLGVSRVPQRGDLVVAAGSHPVFEVTTAA